MTSRERHICMYERREADRVPITDIPWGPTLERWRNQGLPPDVDWEEFFDIDRVAYISVDNSPQYPVATLEETDEYRIHTTAWGATLKDWTHAGSVPQFLHFTIHDRDSWEAAKARMQPTDDRIPWDILRREHPRWVEEGWWKQANLWFGFDVTHAWTVGTERILMAMIEDPEWCRDMFETFLDVNLALLDKVWDAGYTFDSVHWPDDMGYKHAQFFSLRTYRNVLKPVHARAAEWAHRRGVKVHLHSCGDINPFIPDLIEIGVDCLNPLEVKAGMDPIRLKKEYGRDLVLHGGINALLWEDLDKLEEEMARILPVLKEGGGYIFSTDHSVPDSVTIEGFRRITTLAKELGAYGN
jgi:uroporphyrinogen decarboxylase